MCAVNCGVRECRWWTNASAGSGGVRSGVGTVANCEVLTLNTQSHLSSQIKILQINIRYLNGEVTYPRETVKVGVLVLPTLLGLLGGTSTQGGVGTAIVNACTSAARQQVVVIKLVVGKGVMAKRPKFADRYLDSRTRRERPTAAFAYVQMNATSETARGTVRAEL